MLRAVNLKTEHMDNPLGIPGEQPFLSWEWDGDGFQHAFEIRAYAKYKGIQEELWNSGKLLSCENHARFTHALPSRCRIYWRVRLSDEHGESGEWSEEASFETGLLKQEDYLAEWINPELSCDPQIHKGASYLRKKFYLPAIPEKGRLYITAHGLYEAYINGIRVGDYVLAPGTSDYDNCLYVQTYDVTDLLTEGENKVQVILGDGWYRGCSGIEGDRNLFGDDIALFFQLEADGVPVCLSDESWEASQDGPIIQNDMQQGEVVDGRILKPQHFHSVRAVSFDKNIMTPSICVQIREKERLEGSRICTPNGETVIDFGQNLAGYIEFSIIAHEGQVVRLTHAETLDQDGNFTSENFQDRKRHKEGGIRQQVIYTCCEGMNHYKTKFSIWGFRYALIETDADLADAQFTAIAVYSDMDQLSSFSCSDQRVNQLFSNALWSMKSNFCDIPTDCPTRERAGWTGDMCVFASTALYLMDCYPVIRKWLRECRFGQLEDGAIANIAPKNSQPTFYSKILAGSVGWGDAVVHVPYELYKRTGDIDILRENYAMMKRWMEYLESRAKKKDENSDGSSDLDALSCYRIESGIDYGEWCEPDRSSIENMGKPQPQIATAWYAASCKRMAEIAALVDKPGDAAYYRENAGNIEQAFREMVLKNGRIISGRQADYVRALAFQLLPEDVREQAAKDLAGLIREKDYHLNTGFLSTGQLCPVLTEYGQTNTAYRLLLQERMPGWLYEVQKGATTIWESWDGIKENGEVNNSLNHYSYGAIAGWLISGVCGIHLEGQKITVSPSPDPLLQFASAEYHSPLGLIKSSWHYEKERIRYDISIPPGTKAEVILPDGNIQTVAYGHYVLEQKIIGK